MQSDMEPNKKREDDLRRHDNFDEERARRIQALGEIAKRSPNAPGDHPQPATTLAREPRATPARTHPRRLRILIVVGAVVCLAVAAAGLARLLTSSPHVRGHAPSGTRVISLASYEKGCLQDVAWSPKGTSVAVIGYMEHCPINGLDLVGPSGFSYGATVSVYAASSGALIAQFHPDAAVTPAIQVSTAYTQFLNNIGVPVVADFVTNYEHVLWSPDGTRLAVTFNLFLPSGPPQNSPDGTPNWPGSTIHGVLLASADGTPQQVWTDQSKPSGADAVWDVVSGATVAPAGMSATGLSAALGYQWNGSSLAPETLLNPATPPALAAPGNPDGGATYTIWQSAEVKLQIVATVPNGIVTVVPGAYTLREDFAAWSPDGRYLAPHASTGVGRFVPEGIAPPTDAGLAQLGLSWAPVLPVRDAALQHALASMPRAAPDSSIEAAQSLSVAWSPSGRVLAARESSPLDDGHTTQLQPFAVTFYDCATGKPLATLTPPSRVGALGSFFAPALLRWSPDGTRLLLFDAQLGALYIWDAPAR